MTVSASRGGPEVVGIHRSCQRLGWLDGASGYGGSGLRMTGTLRHMLKGFGSTNRADCLNPTPSCLHPHRKNTGQARCEDCPEGENAKL